MLTATTSAATAEHSVLLWFAGPEDENPDDDDWEELDDDDLDDDDLDDEEIEDWGDDTEDD